jgi:hypothetical protein
MYVKATCEKTEYTVAKLEVLLFRSGDVIATSATLDPDGTGNDGNMGSWTPPEW